MTEHTNAYNYMDRLTESDEKFLNAITVTTMRLLRSPEKRNDKISSSEFSGFKTRLINNIILLENGIK